MSLRSDFLRVSLLKRRRIAVRWSAPEVLLGRPQSPASNVWSYGVLAWEVMSFGQLPYDHWNDDQVAAAVTSGAVLSRPSVCVLTLLYTIRLCYYSGITPLKIGVAQTPLHGHRLRTCCTTPPTDINGRAHNNSTTNLPHRNARADISRCWCVANFCPLVVTLLYNKL